MSRSAKQGILSNEAALRVQQITRSIIKTEGRRRMNVPGNSEPAAAFFQTIPGLDSSHSTRPLSPFFLGCAYKQMRSFGWSDVKR